MFNSKQRYFDKKLKAIKFMVMDLEFKRYKVADQREQSRQQYDDLRGRMANLDDQIKKETETPTLDKDERARLDDQKVVFERDIQRLKENMDGFDLEIHGTGASSQYPDGVQGINQQIGVLRDLAELIVEYKKTL